MTVETIPMDRAEAERVTERIREGLAALAAMRLPRPTTCRQAGRHLYLIESALGCVKIGRANDPARRLAELRTGHPAPLRLIHVVPDAGDQELALHARLSQFRLSGEWFEGIPEIYEWFEVSAL